MRHAQGLLLLGALTMLAVGSVPPAAAARTGGPGSDQLAWHGSDQLRATYVVRVNLNWAAGRLDVTTDMDADNVSGGTVTHLDLNTIAARLGSMRLLESSVNGQAVTPRVSDQTIGVALPAALAPGGHVWVHTRYRATLLSSSTGHDWLWSKVNGVAAAYRFIPWLSRPTPFDRPNDGDPFVTPVADDVRVTFTSSVPLIFATSGEEIGSGELGLTYDARDVRDFSFTASPSYRVLAGRSRDGQTDIRVVTRWATSASAKHTLHVARDAIAQYEAWLGPYPYPSITIAETAAGVGMESPGLVWLPRNRTGDNYLIAHELGHQWFYAVVGNDEARDPFFDEAMTDFLARTFLHQLRSSRCATARLDLTIYRYSGRCYYEIVYIQGSLFIDRIRRDMGSAYFWATLRDFWTAHRFTISSTHQLLEAFRAAAGNGLLPRYRARFPSLYPS